MISDEAIVVNLGSDRVRPSHRGYLRILEHLVLVLVRQLDKEWKMPAPYTWVSSHQTSVVKLLETVILLIHVTGGIKNKGVSSQAN